MSSLRHGYFRLLRVHHNLERRPLPLPSVMLFSVRSPQVHRLAHTRQFIPDPPETSSVGSRVLLALAVIIGGIFLGSNLSQLSARFLEENDIFVAGDED
ncbi:hypothetical protein BV898_06468 [Hypsibius exemplaris]|uniref:Essential MCU regulator, mitochondrial n=1 Tax=Hypsibius exemplaris TaxID=2072580 RepID=A0A1W0WWC8_HYPEX|nr:hypothetical protein BV898_06468 [Hypsibius exemplaris]